MAVRDSSVVGGSSVTTLDTDPISVVAGDTISVWFNYGNTTDPTAVTDDLGNTYVQRRKVSRGFTSWRYDCVSVATGSGTITLNIGVTEHPTLAAASISGLTGSALDIDSQLDTDTSQPWSLATGTLAQADEDVFAWIGADSGTPTDVFVETSGMAILGQESDSGLYWTGALAYRAVNATTSYVPAFTNAAGGSNSVLITTTFKRAGATDTPLNPAQDAVVLTGPAPTLAQTANQSVVPSADAIALTGPAPALAQTANQDVSPAADAVVLTGPAPTLAQTAGQTVSPAADTIALTGPAPTLAQTANQSVVPDAATVAFTGPAPTITQEDDSTYIPAPGQIVLTGPAPTLAQTANVVITPDADNIALQGQVPTIVQAAPQAPAASGVRRWLTEYYTGYFEKREKDKALIELSKEIEQASAGQVTPEIIRERVKPAPRVTLTPDAAQLAIQRQIRSEQRELAERFRVLQESQELLWQVPAVLAAVTPSPRLDEQDDEDYLLLASVL
jgi:hypothetical protein